MKRHGAHTYLKSIAIFLLASLCLASCDSFLDVEPVDRIDSPSFFSTDQELLIGVNGVYAALMRYYSNGITYFIIESRSDNAFMDHTDQAERVATDIFAEVPAHLGLDVQWGLAYNTVNLANTVIVRGPDAAGDAALIGRLVGEAKFIRAYTYFHLVVLWGGVPLRTTATDDFENAIVARASVDEVYSLIIQDLTDASSALPASYAGGAGNEVGRATRFAALTLLGKVHLQRGNAADAVAALRQVEGQYSLLPNYGDIHAAGNDNTAESIFEINHNPANQTGLGRTTSLVPASEAARLGIVAGGNTRAILAPGATQDLIDAFDDATDLRIPHTFGTAAGVEPGGYISKYIDLNEAAAGADVNEIALRYADVLLMLAEALGEGGEAYGLINQVRTRAGLPDIDASTPGTFMEKLMKERRLEFAFEMHRWFDLRRLPDSETIAIMNDQLNKQQVFFLPLPAYTGPSVFNLTPERLLFPIIQLEIDISGGVVTQNPGH